MSQKISTSHYGQSAIESIRSCGGCIRMAEAIRIGINRRTLYMLRDNGKIELISRGLYRLSSLPPFSHPDMIAVALRVPQSVFCLISALSFHEITTQIPQAVDIAIQFGIWNDYSSDYIPTDTRSPTQKSICDK